MTWNNSAEKDLFEALEMFPLSVAFMCLDHTAGVLADSCTEGSSLRTSVRIVNEWSNNLSPDFIHVADLMASDLQRLRITHDWHNFDMTDIHLPIRRAWNQITLLFLKARFFQPENSILLWFPDWFPPKPEKRTKLLICVLRRAVCFFLVLLNA